MAHKYTIVNTHPHVKNAHTHTHTHTEKKFEDIFQL